MHFLTFFAVYFYLFLSGFWLYVLCVPREKSDAATMFMLSPILGVCSISLYYTNTIAWSVPFSSAKTPLQAATLLLTAVAFWAHRKVLKANLQRAWGEILIRPRRHIVFAGALLLMTAGLISPILGRPLTTPWRIGPDAAGYSNCAAFLLQDKTLASFNGKFTSPDEIYAYEFMTQVFRRGYASVAAATADAFHRHPTEIIFLLTAVLLFLCLLVTFRLARRLLEEDHLVIPCLLAIAVAFNCNLLFILYEGGYAQVASMPLIMAVVLTCFGGLPSRGSSWRSFLTLGVLLGASAELYLESMFIIPMFALGYLAALTVAERRWPLRIRDLGVIAGAVGLAFLLNWDVMSNWFRFQKENAYLLSLAGWPQPQWAYLPEIMGWVDIYRHVVGNVPGFLNQVTRGTAAMSILVSCFFTALILISALRGRRIGILASVPMVMVWGAYWYFKFHRQVHNYGYMKIYTLALPALAVGALGVLSLTGRKHRWGAVLAGALALLTCVNGVAFMRCYRSNYAVLSEGILELKDVEKHTDLDDYVLLVQPETDEHKVIRDVFIRSYFAGKLVHPAFFPQQDFSADRGRFVALVVRSIGRSPSCDPADVLWRGKEYIVLNTRIPIEQAWKDKGRIPWAPRAGFIPRPEIEVQWSRENYQNGVCGQYDFTPFFKKGEAMLSAVAD